MIAILKARMLLKINMLNKYNCNYKKTHELYINLACEATGRRVGTGARDGCGLSRARRGELAFSDVKCLFESSPT
jgi:hypothetical protein